MVLPDVKDLAGAPTWLAVSLLVVAVLTPVLSSVLPRVKERRRKQRRHRHPDKPADLEFEPAAINQAVTGATGMLDEAIDDLRAQRDRAESERKGLQRSLDRERAESARKDVTIARLEAQVEVYRNQQGNRGGQP